MDFNLLESFADTAETGQRGFVVFGSGRKAIPVILLAIIAIAAGCSRGDLPASAGKIVTGCKERFQSASSARYQCELDGLRTETRLRGHPQYAIIQQYLTDMAQIYRRREANQIDDRTLALLSNRARRSYELAARRYPISPIPVDM